MRLLARRMRETGREYALRNLKDNIIHLELKPGSMVSENELAAQMGLSRTPVREALMELSKVRLVDVYPQRGSAVALIDYDLVEEARFMRDVLEGAVVELDCDMLTEDALARLRENIALQRHHLADGAMERLWSLDNAFHSLLFQIARKEQTYQMMTGFTAHFDRVRNMSLVTVKNSKIVDDHALIVDALAARDKAAVRHLMAHHLSRYKVDEAACSGAPAMPGRWFIRRRPSCTFFVFPLTARAKPVIIPHMAMTGRVACPQGLRREPPVLERRQGRESEEHPRASVPKGRKPQ